MNAYVMRRYDVKNQHHCEETRAETEAHGQDKQGLGTVERNPPFWKKYKQSIHLSQAKPHLKENATPYL